MSFDWDRLSSLSWREQVLELGTAWLKDPDLARTKNFHLWSLKLGKEADRRCKSGECSGEPHEFLHAFESFFDEVFESKERSDDS